MTNLPLTSMGVRSLLLPFIFKNHLLAHFTDQTLSFQTLCLILSVTGKKSYKIKQLVLPTWRRSVNFRTCMFGHSGLNKLYCHQTFGCHKQTVKLLQMHSLI
ncbi:hypothetical protein KIL84_022672 [Mauremys mutica]|uniref:Uncharacterized protein n=1 Tax=Mauremys mutica TaxID=74926 RepID=A0A9D3WPT6_9SAUR|nr:hypothetical protein KIL84_022672 [Mauremys mutica]